MKHKFIIILLSLLLMLTFAAPAFAQGPFSGGKVVFGDNFTLKSGQTLDGDLAVFGGNVTTEPDSMVKGDMIVFGGNVTANGTVDGDVAAIGGNVTINGRVNGDIGSMGGNVTVSESATVEGDIATFGGRADVAEGADVRGGVASPHTFEFDGDNFDGTPPKAPRPDFGPDHSSDWPFGGIFGWLGRVIGGIFRTVALLVTVGLISWLVAAFLPEQMMTVRNTLSDSTAISFGMGLLTTLVAVFVGGILFITICLAFIPIIAWIVLAIAALFGWIVIGHILGERLLAATGRHDSSLVASTLVGVLVLTLLTNMPVIGEIPCIGWLLGFLGAVIGIILSITGLGAVLLTRFGTRPYPAAPAYSGGFSGGGPTPRPSGSSGPRVHWTDPAPTVSEDDPIASEAELNARIKAALADEPKPAAPTGEAPDAPKPEPEPEPEDTEPDPDLDTPGK